jgi:hypothetical protein
MPTTSQRAIRTWELLTARLKPGTAQRGAYEFAFVAESLMLLVGRVNPTRLAVKAIPSLRRRLSVADLGRRPHARKGTR